MAYRPDAITQTQLTAAIAANPGPPGPKGDTGTSYNFVDGEKPTGVTSGLNKQYTLAQTPNRASSLHLYIAGLRVDPANYSLSGAVVTILATLVTGLVACDYRY